MVGVQITSVPADDVVKLFQGIDGTKVFQQVAAVRGLILLQSSACKAYDIHFALIVLLAQKAPYAPGLDLLWFSGGWGVQLLVVHLVCRPCRRVAEQMEGSLVIWVS